MLFLGDVFPNLSANTTDGDINLHEWLGDSWGILFSHPSDFTPVCTTELARVLDLLPEFKKRNVEVIGLSCDSVSSHIEWCKDIKSYADVFPNLSANTTDGDINLHEWLGDSWGILFSHPSDFTPVCTTELARVLDLLPEFKKRNVKVIGLSCDSVSSHIEWCKDIKSYAGYNEDEKFPYPIIEDEDRKIAMQLGMVDKDELDNSGMPLSARAVFIVDSNKKYRLSLLYPATTGRNFDEILRVVDSLQLTDKAKVATPVDWKMGDDCMVLPTLPEDQLDKVFPEGVTVVPLPSGKNYLRKTSCPKI